MPTQQQPEPVEPTSFTSLAASLIQAIADHENQAAAQPQEPVRAAAAA